jgi:hypothetical protein
MVLHVQLHHCLSLLPTLHGVVNIEVKQIAKQNLYSWIFFPSPLIRFHEHIVSPQICTNYHVFKTYKLVSIFSCTFHCISTKVTLITLSPHPFGLTFGNTIFDNNLFQILGRPIALPTNVLQGSIIARDDILYYAGDFCVMGILDPLYCIIFGVWTFTTLFNIYNSISSKFSSSCYQIVAWFSWLCKLWVTMWFMFIPALLLFLEKLNCYISKSLQ